MVSRSSTLLTLAVLLLTSAAQADAPACDGIPYATPAGLACEPVRPPPAGPGARSADAEQLRREIAETEAARRAYQEGAASFAKALSESALRGREIADDAQARLTQALAELARVRHDYDGQVAALQAAVAAPDQKLAQLGSGIEQRLGERMNTLQAAVDSTRSEVKTLRDSAAASSQRLDQLAAGLQHAQASIDALATGLRNQENAAQDNQKALTALQAGVSGLDKLRLDLASTQASADQAAAKAGQSRSHDAQEVEELRTRLAQLQQRVDGDEKTAAALRAAATPVADTDTQQMRATIAEQSRRIQALERQVAGTASQAPAAAAAQRGREARPIKAEPPGRLDCAALAPDNERMWDLAVAKAYPGFRLVYVDPQAGSAWMSSSDGAKQAASLDQIARRAGCAGRAAS